MSSPRGTYWPPDPFDISAIKRSGWTPTPIREFVLKIRQDCNLACRYCYVYTMPDRSWQEKPRVMSAAVRTAAIERIVRHATEHNLESITVVLHGGEPLLNPVPGLVAIADQIRAALPASVTVNVALQTNGTLASEAGLSELAAAGIGIGVSIDGPQAVHDLRRPHRRGDGSFRRTADTIRLLGQDRFRNCFTGLLCVVPVDSDPAVVYSALMSFDPPSVNLLLPHANWSTTPRAPVAPDAFGRWLAQIFDAWYDEAAQPTRIRLFEDVMSLLLGGHSRGEQVGISPVAVAIVESDGRIEQSDSLKSAFAGAAATGYSVQNDDFDRVLTHPGFIARQIGLAALCDECRQCRIGRLCGGGLYAHRYHRDTGYLNRSVYCHDLMFLFDHVYDRMRRDLAAVVKRTA